MKVAVAIITDAEDKILLTQRPLHVPHGGSWEFPGGKLEDNETSEAALIREIKEEIGIDVQDCRLVGEIQHRYVNHSVHLFVYEVNRFTGTPLCLEGQLSMQWVDKSALIPEHFPEANRAIIDLIWSNT